ncbi:MAG: pyridoxamine 5'-phosphate oxidase [Polyangiaceae bacterium]|nr:pyridoxamine 5'-phosphate oxidase [Polyangiaceae bacterium]
MPSDVVPDRDRSFVHPGDPIHLFNEAFARARTTEPFDATAMTLATVDERGMPSARVVLLKGVDEGGFVFFTNYDSRKARELDGQRVAALCVHWPTAEEQVRIEGTVTRVSAEESDAYFATRPRRSQLGAWASDQSRPVESREVLEARLRELEIRFEGNTIPRPPHWGGYRVTPSVIEFWYGRPNRLHDRIRYERAGGSWTHTRLYP